MEALPKSEVWPEAGGLENAIVTWSAWQGVSGEVLTVTQRP